MSAIRLRQVAVAALNGPDVADQFGQVFGLSGGFQDPGLAPFGLQNEVWPVGAQFLELVYPVMEEAAVSRFLRKRRVAAAGYMVVLQVAEIATYRTRAAAMGIRAVLDSDSDGWGTLHLHPQDMGSLMSVDHDKAADWLPAGPHWREISSFSLLAGIAAVEIAVADPVAMARRWADFLGIVESSGSSVLLGEGTIGFVPRSSENEGLVSVECYMTNDDRVGEVSWLAGTTFRVVPRPSL